MSDPQDGADRRSTSRRAGGVDWPVKRARRRNGRAAAAAGVHRGPAADGVGRGEGLLDRNGGPLSAALLAPKTLALPATSNSPEARQSSRAPVDRRASPGLGASPSQTVFAGGSIRGELAGPPPPAGGCCHAKPTALPALGTPYYSGPLPCRLSPHSHRVRETSRSCPF